MRVSLFPPVFRLSPHAFYVWQSGKRIPPPLFTVTRVVSSPPPLGRRTFIL